MVNSKIEIGIADGWSLIVVEGGSQPQIKILKKHGPFYSVREVMEAFPENCRALAGGLLKMADTLEEIRDETQNKTKQSG